MDRARGNVPWYGLAHTFRERSTSGTLPCAPTDALYRPALCGRRGIQDVRCPQCPDQGNRTMILLAGNLLRVLETLQQGTPSSLT